VQIAISESVTVDDVRQIAAHSDPVVRNLQITQAYHDLATAMAQLTGPGANWCAMATWASKQAGQSIRREDLARTFERLLRGTPAVAQQAEAALVASGSETAQQPRSLGGAVEALWDALNPAAAFERTSDAVARGNLKVFEEIGYEFARFLGLFAAGRPDAAQLASFYDGFQPGDPPQGQHYLRRAFTHYVQALDAADPRAKAQLMLLANLEIGFHEQTRLQPEIVAAMHAPVVDPRVLRRRLVAELFPNPASRLRYWLARLAGRMQPLLDARDRLADETQRIGRQVVTDALMTLAMPDGAVLSLGIDLGRSFPAELQTVDQPELVALLRQVDPTPDSTAGSGAVDWGNLPDRMHFITDLFRVYHLVPALYAAPFATDQVADLRRGVRPAGRL
jgi:hypothetical protein